MEASNIKIDNEEEREIISREEETPMNFYLSSLEEQVRSVLKDSEATLSQCQTEGKVNIWIREDLLSDYFDGLQDRRGEHNTDQGKIIKSVLKKVCMKLQMVQEDRNVVLGQLEQVKGEKEALQKVVETQESQLAKNRKLREMAQTQMEEALQIQEEAKKSQESTEASLRAQLESQDKEHKDLMAALQKKYELQIESDHLRWQQERISLLEEAEKTKSSFMAQLEEQKQKNKNIVAALRDTDTVQKEELALSREKNLDYARCLALERAQKMQLQKNVSRLEQVLQNQEVIKKSLERSKASLKIQLESQERNNQNYLTAQRIKGQLERESDRVCWQHERYSLEEEAKRARASSVAQLEQQQERNNTLVAALKTAEQQLESHRTKWQEEKSSILQATESVKQTLQEKEEEWKKAQSAMASQVEDLESQIKPRKQRNKKWFHCS